MKIRDLLKSDEESQVIVPFSYDEITSIEDDYFLRNRFRNYFYTRDLFSFQNPLKKDIYFFGRTDLIYQIVARHETNENSGLFGLRRSGKTSVIFGVERTLQHKDAISVWIDCQDTAMHQRRWYQALWYILNRLTTKYNINVKIGSETKYTETHASELFQEQISKIHRVLETKKILIIFDEIENITFDISPSPHWEKGLDFVYFWQSLRSVCFNLNCLSYLIVGTNPRCIETPKVLEKDNPIFMGAKISYIEGFDILQTREMVRKLGSIMGLKFDETVYAKLTEDFGGHPFLIRMVCSVIHRITNQTERPIRVTRSIYNEAKQIFYQESQGYIELILKVLNDFYKDEYELLEMLALGDTVNFKDFVRDNPDYITHLIGYGIIEQSGESFDFRIDAVKSHLQNRHRYDKKYLTLEEKRIEVTTRRNQLEIDLRAIISQSMRMVYGEENAQQKILSILGGKRAETYQDYSYWDIFDANQCNLYFEDLRKIILSEWTRFQNIFGRDKTAFDLNMQMINAHRVDAHPKNIDDEQMDILRGCLSKLETSVKNHFGR